MKSKPNPLRKWILGALRRILAPLVRSHRRSLTGTRFIAITGSTGKTTAKNLLVAVLARQGEVVSNPGTDNLLLDLFRTVLRTRKRHSFCVQELGAWAPGSLDRELRSFEPDVTVVTNIGIDHHSTFKNHEGIALEKSKAVAVLPDDGIAVLNADDPRVAAMASLTRARVVLYGSDPDADVRVLDSNYSWPRHLTLKVSYRDSICEVNTKLHGVHWTTSVLAALASGIALGSSLKTASRALATVETMNHRLSVSSKRSGVVFLLDDWKSNELTLACALEVLGTAVDGRRIAVIGQISDGGRSVYRNIARMAKQKSDLVVMVGRWAHYGLGARQSPEDESVQAFETVRSASHFLDGWLGPGDLVLLSSSSSTHLSRLALRYDMKSRNGMCWQESCGKKIFCENCRSLSLATS